MQRLHPWRRWALSFLFRWRRWRRWRRWWLGSARRTLALGDETLRFTAPPPGFVFITEADVSELQAMAWIDYLRAELPFPQPVFGSAEAPASPQELRERLSHTELEILDALALGSPETLTDEEPDWFVAFADRYLPLACWSVGFGLGSTSRVELPEFLRRAEGGLRGLLNRPPFDSLVDLVERLREQVENLGRHNADAETAHLTLWRVHFEALLRGLSPAAPPIVEFALPSPGAKIAELVPAPAPGSSTSGPVVRVLAPSVTVRVFTHSGERRYARGALVRSR